MKALAIAALCGVLAGGCASTPPAAGTDWSRVATTTDGGQIMAWKTIARYCDAWYKGEKPTIDLRFTPDGHLDDGAGHRMKMRATDFKGIVEATRVPGARVEAFASMSDVYSSGRSDIPQDKFGLKARYRYRMTAVSDDVLRLTVVEKIDAGM